MTTTAARTVFSGRALATDLLALDVSQRRAAFRFLARNPGAVLAGTVVREIVATVGPWVTVRHAEVRALAARPTADPFLFDTYHADRAVPSHAGIGQG